MNREQPTSSMVTTGMETTLGLTYSLARATEVTAWQFIDAVYLCCLTHGACVKATGLQSLLTTMRSKRWLECFHLSMQSPHDLQNVLDQPVYSLLYTL